MNHPPIIVLGYSEAAMLLRQTQRSEVAAVISIAGSQEYHLDADVQHRLDLRFDDVSVDQGKDHISEFRSRSLRRRAAASGMTITPPTRNDAVAIIEFARQHSNLDGTFLLHCQAGISRSPAAALLCLAARSGVGNERVCVDYLFHIRPSAMPHMGVVQFGDDFLERDGRLISDVNEGFQSRFTGS